MAEESINRKDNNMYFYAGKEQFSIILELDELQGLQFDKTGPNSLLSTLRNCYKDGIGLLKYSIIVGEDMCDVIEIVFKNATEQTKAILARPTIQGRELHVYKPLGYRAEYLYSLDIFDVPIGDPEETKTMLCDTFLKFGDILDCKVHVTEDGSWMTGSAYVLLLAYKRYNFKSKKYTHRSLAKSGRYIRVKWSKKVPVYYPVPNQ
ncbi:hypothetical protein FB192DRAFT_1390395 [Mucor lusitanicus]|uniref:Uncharacterized protein n=1 Tax=Mucor circinelloides f. lusitanicus TaxID=29924 RepID=A0A8H4BEL5_MUCCL|nr:hypothetical protein FB192DRAFT_1390395 [Mucor lusitanicus]